MQHNVEEVAHNVEEAVEDVAHKVRYFYCLTNVWYGIAVGNTTSAAIL